MEQQRQQSESQGQMGRPSKEHIVKRYRKAYPQGKKMECARVMGINIKTVSKYWDLYEEKDECPQE